MPNDYDAKIAALQKRLSQVKAKKAKAEARLAQAERKRDTRRKILIGAFYLEKMRADADARGKITAALDQYLTRADDRALFDLPPKG
jgi:large subunit ribosomal protein L7/L12